MGFQAPTAPPPGRRTDAALLRELIERAAGGRGSAVWVEGEPGIGKTSLISAALADAAALGCRTGLAAADEFGVRSPLRVALGCLGVGDGGPDAHHDEILRRLHGPPAPGGLSGADPVLSATESLLALVEKAAARQPLVLVADDVHWADEPSLIAWHRLTRAVERLPLLLIAVSLPAPPRPAVAQLRRSVLARGRLLRPSPLAGDELAALVGELTGAAPGPRLLRLAERAGGNPLHVRELVGALTAGDRIAVEAGRAELRKDGDGSALPPLTSLTSLLRHRLAFLTPPVLEMLGTAALIGPEFTAAQLAAVLQTPVSELLTGLRQALAATVITGSGSAFTFRHPLLRQALRDSLPSALRPVLHRQVARVLAAAGAPAERVAEHLLAGPAPTDRTTLDWIADHAAHLAHQVPATAVELLTRVADEGAGGGRQAVVAGLAQAQLRLGRLDEAERRAWQALDGPAEPEAAAATRWTLTRVLLDAGRDERARAVIGETLRRTALPPHWRARFQALSARALRADGDPDGADARARQALALAESCGDGFGRGYALCVRWQVASVRRDHRAALAAVEEALAVLDDRPEHGEVRSWALESRLVTLQNLDRPDEADAARREAVEAARRGGGDRVGPLIASAVHDFWRGRWDEAVTALGATAPEAAPYGPRERGPVLLLHGISALIAGHRDEREQARRHLAAGAAGLAADREHHDFLLAARALEAERGGAPERAVALLAELLESGPGRLTLVHQWLPDLVRLATETGDTATATAAAEACAAEAAKETEPARAAAAARRCRGLLEADPEPVLAAAAHHAAVGRVFEQAQALEDAAVLLARRRRPAQARSALVEAVARYTELGAVWDVRRADTRARRHGVRRGARGPRPRASFGWEALTPTELRVARLVAEGKSNPEVAADLFLSRRTVQTHVSHILGKLGVTSRVGIATEALRHPEGPAPAG
ncbi:helix-turn-helix transcriptional regulator [Streptomyces sp. NPDC002067]